MFVFIFPGVYLKQADWNAFKQWFNNNQEYKMNKIKHNISKKKRYRKLLSPLIWSVLTAIPQVVAQAIYQNYRILIFSDLMQIQFALIICSEVQSK